MNIDEKTTAVQLLDLARAAAVDGIKNSKWYTSAPESLKTAHPEIKLSGIEYHPVYTSVGGLKSGSYEAPFLCGETKVGEISASFRLRLSFGDGGFVINEI